jgi:hypothetical protein
MHQNEYMIIGVGILISYWDVINKKVSFCFVENVIPFLILFYFLISTHW